MTRQKRRTRDLARRYAWPAMLVLTLVGAALRMYHLGFHELWTDEAFSAWVVAHGFREVLQLCLEDVVHPPLYYFLLLYWTRLAGNSEFTLRMISMGASLLGVPLLYQLGRWGWNRRSGLAAALLWACSPFSIWYAQEARMYAPLTVGGVAALLCLARAMTRPAGLQDMPKQGGSRRWLAANAILNLIGLYTHYYYVFLLLSQGLYLLLTRRRHGCTFRWWVLLNGIGIALYLPWVAVMLHSGWQRAGIGWIPPVSLPAIFWTLWQLGAGYQQMADAKAAFVTIILLSSLSTEVVFGRARPAKGQAIAGLAWSHFLFPPLSIALISLWKPLFYPRYLQIILPAYLLLAAAGLMRLTRRFMGPALIIGMVLLSALVLQGMYSSSSRYQQDWKEAMYSLAASVGPGDVLAFRGGQGWPMYWYYYRGPAVNTVDLSFQEGIQALEARAAGARQVRVVLWDPDKNCELPAEFVPGVDDLQITDTQCFPEVMMISYAQRENE